MEERAMTIAARTRLMFTSIRARRLGVLMGTLAILASATIANASTPGTDVRLSLDDPGLAGYVSADAIAGLGAYTDATLAECSRSRGRQNEPSLAIDPRDSRVMVGSSNDYCAVYNDGNDADGAPIPSGPIWLGYYRSENGGRSFVSSLVPGYPGDTSQSGALARIRTASAGDPVEAWDAEGRLFMGAESSDDPAGTKKTFGDVWVATYVNPAGAAGNTLDDGRKFVGSTVVAKGTSAPNLLGKFHDKTSIEADRTTSACRGNVYFAWSRFTGNGGVGIYFSRSTDHGRSFSTPMKLTEGVHDVQFPDIAITASGELFVTYSQIADGQQRDAVNLVRSSDCGRTFGRSTTLETITPMGLADVAVGGGGARDCGDSASACESGFTFFRADTGPRSTADQADAAHEWVYVLYEAIVPGSEIDTGTTFGWAANPGAGGQSAIYYVRYDGASGSHTSPERVASTTDAQQLFPDLAVDGGTIHALWWDTRNDANNDASTFRVRPPGNDADGDVAGSFDVYAATRPTNGGSWSAAARVSDVTSNGQYEQFGGRTVPFGGDYLWIDSKAGVTFGTWTDWRNTVGGTDQREATADETGADVLQCRTAKTGGAFTGDTCPRDGGLGQDIYGDFTP
jgi:hypothetical protein